MRPQTILVTALALVFGGSSAIGLRQYMRQGLAATTNTVPVVVAAVDIAANSKVTAELLATRAFPKDLVPPEALRKIEDAVDRSAFAPLAKGETILTTKLGPKGQFGLAPKIPKGMRAFTINTPNVASGVAGFILPGNRVDVLLTVERNTVTDAITGGGSVTTLLQNVEVLAVGQVLQTPAENKVDVKETQSVTLLVTPDQAAKLDLGQNMGTLHLTLRHPDDATAAVVRPTTMNDIQFRSEKPGPSWDERAKGVIAALAGAMEKAQAARPKPEPPPAPKEPEKRAIRTLKGAHEGVVIIQPAG